MNPNDISIEDREIYCNRMAENLPILRAALDISQEELGERLGVTRQTIATIESKQKMSWSNFLAMVFVFQSEARSAEMLKLLRITDVEVPQQNIQKKKEIVPQQKNQKKKEQISKKGMKF